MQTIDGRISEPLMGSATPPKVAGDVDIARFLSPSERSDRWRVSIAGRVHFLTDVDTAQRIHALSGGTTYVRAYQRYVELAGADADSFDVFVLWSEKHRDRLERLAKTPDGHPLRFRCTLLSETACMHIGRHLVWLFYRSLAIALVLVSAAVVGGYVVVSSAHWQGSFWLATPLALLGVFVHEMGHIAACVRHGARQGGIGVGLYWIWPAFYADVRGSWSLSARQRLQVSAGGLYFQCIYAAALACLGLLTGNPTFGMAVQITLLLMATTCNPVFKYDGYWMLADLFNATNIHTHIAEHLKRLLNSNASARRALLGTRWTWLSMIFASAAACYIAYIGIELFLSGSAALHELTSDWRSLDASTQGGGRMHLWMSIASVGMQLILIGLALVILGARCLRTSTTILKGRG